MENLVVSQVLSIAAPQLEVDQRAKIQNTCQNEQLSRQGIFLTLIRNSMEEVHDVVTTEKEDPLKDESDEEDSQEES